MMTGSRRRPVLARGRTPAPTAPRLHCPPRRLFETLCRASQVRLPAVGNKPAVHSLSDVRNERNNAALHATDIAVASASAAEIE